MKVEINEGGKIVVAAENTTEQYALRCWIRWNLQCLAVGDLHYNENLVKIEFTKKQ